MSYREAKIGLGTFPLLGLLELCQLAYLQYGVLCLDLAWLVGIFDGSEIYICFDLLSFLSGLHWWEV